MNSILITGSNRGLGLEWVRQYADSGWRVYATCRFPEQATALQQMAAAQTNISIHRLDVTRPAELHSLVDELDGCAIDILVNNAGVYFERWGKDTLGQINYDDWQQTYGVNTLGAMRVSEALIDNVVRSDQKLIIAITSHMGSIAEITAPGDYAYRSSKAALNAVMKGLSVGMAEQGVAVVMLHPGWVRTRMGGESAPLGIAESVSAMRVVVAQFSFERSGRFFRYDGVEIPW